MIRPAGNSTGINKPTAFVSGGSGARVALSSFNVNYTIGAVARAQVGMPAEDYIKFANTGPDTEVKINAFGTEVFTGYVDAPGVSISGDSITASSILVHKARDLDEASLFSPGSHPASTEDFSVLVAFASDDASTSSADATMNRGDLQFEISGNIGEEIVGYITRMMEHLATTAKVDNLPSSMESAARTLADQSPRVMESLEEIIVDGDCSLPASGPPSLNQAASAFARNLALGAMGSGRSPFAIMTAMASAFGLTIVCLPSGKVLLTPDYSGCKPPGGNEIPASSIARFSSTASNSRPPSSVLAVGYGIYMSDYSNPLSYAPVASFTPKVRPSSTSGVYTTGLPGWMVSASRTGKNEPPPVFPEFLGESWAKQIYYQVANLNRTMSVSMPFSPDVSIGTTYRISPTSSARFMSGGGVGIPKSFSGYCYSVTHSMVPDSNDLTTTASFKNIFEDTEEDAMVSGAPLFGDQEPYSAPYSEG